MSLESALHAFSSQPLLTPARDDYFCFMAVSRARQLPAVVEGRIGNSDERL